jgi:hypothetical protein
MVIDFTEIPKANSGDGLQDTFELFSRDFLEDLGFEILQHPDRGADGKKDLIVAETRNGVAGKTTIKWLVSCKHYAHSGKSVNDTDEPDIIDRCAAHKCNGFIGVYSTLAATSLSGKLTGYSDKIEHQIFDRERIEKKLLGNQQGIKLARRYFPKSIEKFITENPKPASIFKEKPEIKCDNCGKDLLTTKNGIFVVLQESGDNYKTTKSGYKYKEEKDVYFSCKGYCDTTLENKYRKQGLWSGGWEDIDDLMIPTLFLKNIMAYMNQLTEQEISKEAHEKMKQLYIRVFPHIARDLTESEKERVKSLAEFGIW